MSKIYTKTGDKGQTSLFNGTRVPKNNIRVEAYGTVDELNSALGLVLAYVASGKYLVVSNELKEIQKDLLEIGAFLANPDTNYEQAISSYFDNKVQSFEKQIDAMTEELPPLSNFILPGGGKAGSLLHLARAIGRRVERRVIELSQTESVEEFIIRYFNRLSDFLFTMSRYVNFKETKKEVIWNKR